MIYIPNAYRQRTDPFVQTLQSSLGGIGEGLRGLAQHKIAEMQEKKDRQQRAAFWKSAGLPDDVAVAFGSAPVELQKALLDRLEGVNFGGNQQQAPAAQQVPQQAVQLEPTEFFDTNQQPSEFFDTAPVEQTVAANAPVNQASGGIKLGASPVERRHKETLAQQERHNQEKLEYEKFKNSKEFRHDVLQKAKGARQTLKDLDRLQELNESGKLDTPGYVEFLKRSGLDIPALMNPESEEFQKIQQNFLRNAKDVFGSRVSNYEAEQFLKAIPSLTQSPEGRKRVISGLKQVARAELAFKEAVKEVIDENKGVPPYDIEERVDDKIDKKLDKIAEQFRKDLKSLVPPAQNKLVTAAQATLGNVGSKIPKALAGAGLGAAAGARYGSVGGVPGAVSGGILGGLAGLSGLGLKDLL